MPSNEEMVAAFDGALTGNVPTRSSPCSHPAR